MPNSNIIPILILLPILGALITLFGTPKSKLGAAGPLAFILSLAPMAVVIWMVATFPGLGTHTDAGWYFNCSYDWVPNLGIRFMMGVDSISLWMIVLTSVLSTLAILGSFKYIKERQAEFYAWMLMLNASLLGVFCAKDLLVFYLFFEFSLIPMFFIIGIWGGTDRRRAAGKFFLFTFAGSVLTLASLIYIVYLNFVYSGSAVPSFAIADLYAQSGHIPVHLQYILFLGLMAGFAVKVPLFPVHTWLPLAHTEAPTAGSVILAGVLLKLGTYGMFRFLVPVMPEATHFFAPYIGAICVIGIIYGALVSWVQGDMKKLIAYSSVSHLGFCVLGMFALTSEGLTGSILYMLNHGLSTGALFLVIGMIYERYHTRDMNQFGGIVRRFPALGFFAVFFVLSSVGLPGLNGFISEFLVLIGTFVSGPGHIVGGFQYGNLGPAFAIPAATGMILSAIYLLYWTGRVVFGPLKEPAHESAHHDGDASGGKDDSVVKDLSLREWAVLVPIAILVLYMGIYPKLIINSIAPPVNAVADSLRIEVPGPANAAARAAAIPTPAALVVAK